MKTRTFVAFLLATALALAPALAGVVYEIEVKDHEQSPPKTESIEAAVEGRHLKMGIASGSTGGKGDMIFRGDRREMIVVDHQDKSYTVIDKETVGAIGSQVQDQMQGAMKELEKQMEGLDPKQREMMEKMLKKKMPGGAMPAPQRPQSDLRKTGERGTQAGYPCVKYEVHRDGRKIREMWVTDWSNIEGGSDVVGAFEDIADFFRELMDSIPDMGQGGNIGDPVFEHMREIGGFPVVTRAFGDDGALEDESTLRSATRRELDPDAFEPPSGYKRRTMLGQ